MLPAGYQANVTLTRYYNGPEADHRYCHVKAGQNPPTCYTDPILTTSCLWSYDTQTEIFGGTRRLGP